MIQISIINTVLLDASSSSSHNIEVNYRPPIIYSFSYLKFIDILDNFYGIDFLLLYVPACCTPVGQPMDAGIIAVMKAKVRELYAKWAFSLVYSFMQSADLTGAPALDGLNAWPAILGTAPSSRTEMLLQLVPARIPGALPKAARLVFSSACSAANAAASFSRIAVAFAMAALASSRSASRVVCHAKLV